MACGCSGSTPRNERTTNIRQRGVTAQPRERLRSGGPGQVGYTWNGPSGRAAPAKPPASE